MAFRDEAGPFARLFEGQIVHALCLAVLLVLVSFSLSIPGATDGSLFGLSTSVWLAALVADTVVHQVLVWVCWRGELHFRLMTRWFGTRAFAVYRTAFAVLFAARLVLIALLGIANWGSLPVYPRVGYVVAAIIAVPTLYLFYSVKTFFTFDRAFGIDHFTPEAARRWPLVRQGIFRITPNAMYVFGIGGLWIPAFLFQSTAAAVAAAFSHLYIWVHYFTVEKPDMDRIYGGT